MFVKTGCNDINTAHRAFNMSNQLFDLRVKLLSFAFSVFGLHVLLSSLKHCHNKKPNFQSSRENELITHFKGSGDSFVPERLMCIRARELLKNCLKDGGTSFPFLQNTSAVSGPTPPDTPTGHPDPAKGPTPAHSETNV